MRLTIRCNRLDFADEISSDAIEGATSLLDLAQRLVSSPTAKISTDLSIRFETDEAPTLDPPAAASQDPPVAPPEPPKAQRLTPGPATIGAGPPPEPRPDPADAWGLGVLLRNLPSKGDRKRLMDMADDVASRTALREAAIGDPRFNFETQGRGVPAWIARVG